MFSETISWRAGFDFNIVLKCHFRLGLPQWFGFLVKTVFLHLLCSGPLGSQQFVQMFFLVGILTPTFFQICTRTSYRINKVMCVLIGNDWNSIFLQAGAAPSCDTNWSQEGCPAPVRIPSLVVRRLGCELGAQQLSSRPASDLHPACFSDCPHNADCKCARQIVLRSAEPMPP